MLGHNQSVDQGVQTVSKHASQDTIMSRHAFVMIAFQNGCFNCSVGARWPLVLNAEGTYVKAGVGEKNEQGPR